MQSKHSGFTLVELLVVISILVLLAGLAVPVVTGVLIMGKVSATRSQLSSLDIALSAYDQKFGGLPHSNAARVAACGDNGNKVGAGYAVTGAEALDFFLRGWYMNGPNVVPGVKYRWKDLGGVTNDVPPMYTPDENEEFVSTHWRYGFGGAPKGRFLGDKFDEHRPVLYLKATTDDTNPFVESDNGQIFINKPRWKGTKSFNDFVIINGVSRAHRYLLWSAGADAVFYTDDDILAGN